MKSVDHGEYVKAHISHDVGCFFGLDQQHPSGLVGPQPQSQGDPAMGSFTPLGSPRILAKSSSRDGN